MWGHGLHPFHHAEDWQRVHLSGMAWNILVHNSVKEYLLLYVKGTDIKDYRKLKLWLKEWHWSPFCLETDKIKYLRVF